MPRKVIDPYALSYAWVLLARGILILQRYFWVFLVALLWLLVQIWAIPTKIVLTGVIIAVVLVLLLWWVPYAVPEIRNRREPDHSLSPKDRQNIEDEGARLKNEVRDVLLKVVGGAAALITLWLTWQQLLDNRTQLQETKAQVTTQLDLTRENEIAERFSRAIGYFGKDGTTEARIGAIVTLEQIALTPTTPLVGGPRKMERLEPTIELLSGFVRSVSRMCKGAMDEKKGMLLAVSLPEAQAAMETLGRLNREQADPIDLTGSYLIQARLAKADLHRAILNNTRLQGSDLHETNLEGASLRGADLTVVKLGGANLQGADLTGADLTGATATDSTKWPEDFAFWSRGVVQENASSTPAPSPTPTPTPTPALTTPPRCPCPCPSGNASGK